jgi:hypothetical protein
MSEPSTNRVDIHARSEQVRGCGVAIVCGLIRFAASDGRRALALAP